MKRQSWSCSIFLLQSNKKHENSKTNNVLRLGHIREWHNEIHLPETFGSRGLMTSQGVSETLEGLL